VCVLATAFAGCQKIGAVKLPDSLEYIGMWAFADSSITEINLPKGLDVRNAQLRESGRSEDTIVCGTFYNCKKLTKVDIEADSIYSVGFMGFLGCESIETMDLTKVEMIQSLAFAGAFAEGYHADLSKSEDYYSRLYSSGTYVSLGFGPFLSAGLSSVTFGEGGYAHIPYEAFRGCKNLSEITWSDHQIEVGTESFMNCKSLTGDIFAKGCALEALQHYAFANTGMTEITIPESMMYLGGGTFAGNPQLETVNWKSAKYFGTRPADDGNRYQYAQVTTQFFAIMDDSSNGAYMPNSGLGQFEAAMNAADSYPAKSTQTGIKTLNLYAALEDGTFNPTFFEMQAYLETVNVHTTWKKIPLQAFMGCPKLKEFRLDDAESLEKVGDRAFAVCGFTELVLPGSAEYGESAFAFNRNLKKVVIEEGVKELPFYLFERAENLQEISVPESLTRVGVAAFKGTGDHASFYAGKNVTVIEDDTFAYYNGQKQRFELFLMGDPVIEYYHEGLSGSTSGTDALDNYSVYRIWTNRGTNFEAYAAQSSYMPSDIRPLPAMTVEVTSTQKTLELGEAPDKSQVKVKVNGIAIHPDEFDLEYDTADRTTGERTVKVILKNVDEPQLLTSHEITADNFYTSSKRGPVYEVTAADDLKYTVEVIAAEYTFTKGDGSTFTKHQDTEPLAFTVKRAEKDELTFERFSRLLVDGKEVDPANYTAQAGSLDAALAPEYLESLPLGEHAITAEFTDGQADGTFTVEAVPPETVSTEDSRSDGIRIHLFDYHIASDWWQYGDRWANAGGQWSLGGINDDSNLKFYGHGGDTVTSGNSNQYTGTSKARQGIVQPMLGEDGYPVMTEFGQQSLSVLFSPENVEGKKTVYKDVNHLFQKDGQGNYYYDSDENYAYYDPAQGDGGDFKVYDGTYQVNMTNPENQATEEKINVGYYPFDDWDESKDNVSPTDDLRDQGIEGYNHQHGLTMECDFFMPEDGKIDGEDLVFSFSGDDDVWVFIDDVLVLDVGGLHRPVGSEINFATGEVKVDDAVDMVPWEGNAEAPQTIGTYNTIDDIFAAAGKTFDKGSVKHTLKFFYLERGGCYSNMSLMTNLWKVTGDEEYTQIRVTKEWADGAEEHEADTVTVQLLADGEPVEGKTGELSAETDWQYEFTRLPKYKGEGEERTEIVYSVEEAHVDGYFTEYLAGGKLITQKTHWVQVDPAELEDGGVYAITSNYWIDDTYDDVLYFPGVEQLGWKNGVIREQSVTDTEGNEYDTVLKTPLAASDAFTAQKVTDEDGTEHWILANGGRALTLVGHNNWNWWGEIHEYSFRMSDQNGWNGQENNNYNNLLTITPDGEGTATIHSMQYWGYGGDQADPEQYMFLNGDGTVGATDHEEWSGHYRFFKQVTEEQEIPISEDWTVKNSPAGSLTITKKVEGPKVADHEFTFTVTLSDETLNGTFGDMEFTGGVATVTLKDGESATAKDLPAGLTYTVSETPRIGYTTEAENETGEIVAKETAEAVFTNTVETTQVEAEKIWDDADDQDGLRPESIELVLLADGEEAARLTVEAGEDGSWKGTFEDLPVYNADGEKIVYTIQETEVDKYTSEITGDAESGFTVTNTHVPEETTTEETTTEETTTEETTTEETTTEETTTEETTKETTTKDTPTTGDDSRLGLWGVLFVTSVCTAFFLLCRRKRHDSMIR
ncbi:MAG: leucine-rich repeat protein, partial [Lachnospiraceae bacterium]|nr:leucine-rich repeat protein [Lachnospiraceae bacterium]